MQKQFTNNPHPQASQPRVAIVGAGLAGAACAQVLARQGFQVVVFELCTTPAAAASGVPVAMFAPSVSADDALHSRCLREGVHLLVADLKRLSAAGLLQEKQDWCMSGVEERCLRTAKQLPQQWKPPLDAPELQSRYLQKPHACETLRTGAEHTTLWHGAAGWVKPTRLIHAWLQHPKIELRTLAGLDSEALRALMNEPSTQAVVLATGQATGALLFDLLRKQNPALALGLSTRLQSIRGQVQWGERGQLCEQGLTQIQTGQARQATQAIGPGVQAHPHANASNPINGMGHWLSTPDTWLAGATFQRDDTETRPRSKDSEKNLEKLCALLPETESSHLTALLAQGKSWVGLRAAQNNRQPWIAQPCEHLHPKLWVCAGLGSRGLSLSLWCAQDLVEKMQARAAAVKAQHV